MVIVLILLLLYMTFNDMLDTLLVFLAVIGALAGAVMFQAALRLQLQRHRLDRLRRRLRHGDANGRHHARLPARIDRNTAGLTASARCGTAQA